EHLRLTTIRDTLLVGFAALVFCLVIAGIVGWMAVRAGAGDVTGELQSVLATAQQTSDYSNIVTREIQAASAYLANGDSVSLREFRQLGHSAHGFSVDSAARNVQRRPKLQRSPQSITASR